MLKQSEREDERIRKPCGGTAKRTHASGMRAQGRSDPRLPGTEEPFHQKTILDNKNRFCCPDRRSEAIRYPRFWNNVLIPAADVCLASLLLRVSPTPRLSPKDASRASSWCTIPMDTATSSGSANASFWCLDAKICCQCAGSRFPDYFVLFCLYSLGLPQHLTKSPLKNRFDFLQWQGNQ